MAESSIFPLVACALHAVLQFFLWSQLDRIDRPVNRLFAVAWSVLSFPVFSMLPQEYSTRWFWFAFFLNSVLWGGAVYGIGLARKWSPSL